MEVFYYFSFFFAVWYFYDKYRVGQILRYSKAFFPPLSMPMSPKRFQQIDGGGPIDGRLHL